MARSKETRSGAELCWAAIQRLFQCQHNLYVVPFERTAKEKWEEFRDLGHAIEILVACHGIFKAEHKLYELTRGRSYGAQ